MEEESIVVSVRCRPPTEKEALTMNQTIWIVDKEQGSISYQPASSAHPPTTPTKTTSITPTKIKPPTPNAQFQPEVKKKISAPPSPLHSTTPVAKSPSIVLGGGRDAARSQQYNYDFVFDGNDMSTDVYDQVAGDIIWSTMNGYNGTIFAYGQTASGKTHTMQGNKKSPGIIPLAIRDIFECIKDTPDRQYLLRVSYLEIYNEVINDLLQPNNVNLKIHEDKDRIYVGNLREEVVLSPEHVISLISAGEAVRHIGATDFNAQSSRSHTIFRMVIESKDMSSEGAAVRMSYLNLIDLAGSERVSYDVTNETLRRKEGGHINKSLHTLGLVIFKLSEKAGGHVPFRDSKLTRILQPSLSGNSRVAIICTISPSPINFEETNSTLKFASRAKKIKAKAKVNEVVDDKALLKQYQNEISDLKKRLDQAQNEKQKDVQEIHSQKEKAEEAKEQLWNRVKEQEVLVEGLQEKIRHLTKLILDSSSVAQNPSTSSVTKNLAFSQMKAPPPELLRKRGSTVSITPRDSLLSPRDDSREKSDLLMTELRTSSTSLRSDSNPSSPIIGRRTPSNTISHPQGPPGSESAVGSPSAISENHLQLGEAREECRKKDEQITLLRSVIDLLQSTMGSMKDEAARRELQMEGFKSDLGKTSEMLSRSQQKAITMEKTIQFQSKLEATRDVAGDQEVIKNLETSLALKETILQEKELEIQMLRADNNLLTTEIIQKEKLIQEWMLTAEQYWKDRLSSDESKQI
eukprot:TRINITY_DN7698_c0_g1_i1.p1 TRINITY_DN7698_c0_g1~~TRINITY_DN7698_c0_g1_i1.p1  ORF type:complete len:746 (-),score=188.75 TRINITY_DN7698_c0_g1_i1:135-2372(-)